MDTENTCVLAAVGALAFGLIAGFVFAPDNTAPLQRVIDGARHNPACEQVITQVIDDLKSEDEARHDADEARHDAME